MNLDEAINHCVDVIKRNIDECDTGCAAEHAQLLLWLIELKERRKADAAEV